MAFVTVIDNDPGTIKRMTFPTRTLYDMAVEAHRAAAEVAGYHEQQLALWNAADRPTKPGPKGHPKADGYFVLPPMQYMDIVSFLQDQYERIKFLGTAVNEYIELSDEEFKEYTAVRYRLKGND